MCSSNYSSEQCGREHIHIISLYYRYKKTKFPAQKPWIITFTASETALLVLILEYNAHTALLCNFRRQSLRSSRKVF